jgi:PAS domain S-box-containing protein
LAWSQFATREDRPARVRGGSPITTMNPLSLYRHVLACIPDHVSVVDRDYVYRLVGDAYLRAHGKQREAIEGHHVIDLFGADTFQNIIKPRLDRCFAGEEVRYEAWFMLPGLGRRFMSVIYAPYINDQGTIIGAIVSARDNTDQRRFQDAFETSDADYRGLFDNMLHGYAYCRMLYEAGRPVDWVYIKVNQAFEELTGLTRVTGRKVSEVLPGLAERNPELFEIYDRVAQRASPERFEVYLAELNRWFSVSVYSPKAEHFVTIFDNITETKLHQQALQREQERIQLLLDSMAEGMYGVDLDGLCTFINPAGLRILGYERVDQVVGQRIHGLIHHHYADGRLYPAEECRALNAYRLNQGVHIEDEVFWRQDGRAVPVEYWSYPMRVNGSVIGSVVTFQDITERREAQQKLFEATQMLQLVIDTVPHYVFWKDRESHYLGANKAFARLAGVTNPNELIGLDDHDFAWRPYAQLYQNDDAQVMASGMPKHGIIEPMNLGDGQTHWLETHKEPLHDTNGQVMGVLGIFQDVTERIHAEERLRQAAKVFESTTEGVMITDLEGCIIAVNQAFSEITGYTEAEVLGRNPSMLKSNRHDEIFYRGIWTSIRETSCWQGEIWNRRKNGEVYPEWLTINTVLN